MISVLISDGFEVKTLISYLFEIYYEYCDNRRRNSTTGRLPKSVERLGDDSVMCDPPNMDITA